MQRIFAAVKILPNQELIRLLKHMQGALVKDKIKWVEPSNIHITLKFFGETQEDKVTQITETLSEIKTSVAFPIRFMGLGIFGSSYKPRVIWLGVQDTVELFQIENSISLALQHLGYQPDRQNFVPHITLGRINFLNDKKYFQDVLTFCKSFTFDPQIVSAFQLYESILKPGGPEYNILRSYNLGK